MKTLFTLALCSALLLFSSCKKMLLKADGTDIAYAMKQGYQYNTWIIDDDNQGNHDITQNSNTYKDKKDPEIMLKKNDSYVLTYSQNNSFGTEGGSYSIDATAKTITFRPSGKPEYTYKISCLTQESFTWVATSEQTTMVKNSEGTLEPRVTRTNETLYMEDND